MLVAASTECYYDLPLSEAVDKLGDLEFSAVEIAIHEHGGQIKPSQVAQDVEKAAAVCRGTHRLDVVAYSVEIDAGGEEDYDQFTAICRLAKATKVVTLNVPSGELGTPHLFATLNHH